MNFQPSNDRTFTGPHQDPLPSGSNLPPGAKFIDLDTGGRFIATGPERTFSPEFGSTPPGTPITPLVSGAETPYFRFGNSSAAIYYLRAVVNASSATDAQTRLHVQWPGVDAILLGTEWTLEGWTIIRRLDLIAYAAADNTSGGMMDSASNAAEVGTNLKTWTFSEGDRVLKLSIKASLADATANVHVSIMGVGYA